MTALYLTPEANDLAFTDGALRFTASATEVAVQKARVRLSFWLGEWFLDTTEGFPYIDQVYIKRPNLPLIESLVRRTLLSIPEVDAVTRCVATLDRATRELSIDWELRVGDEVATAEQYGPFVLGL